MIDKEDSVIIELKCNTCDNVSCPIVQRDSELWHKYGGCSRRVDEDTAIKYFHYEKEIFPFIKQYQNIERQIKMLNECLDFLFENIYNAEFIHYYTHKGTPVLKK